MDQTAKVSFSTRRYPGTPVEKDVSLQCALFRLPVSLACNCTEHGSCDQGVKGTGSCFCDEGWTGQRCENKLGTDLTLVLFQSRESKTTRKYSESVSYVSADGPVCSPACHEKAVCMENNTCVCKPFYEGDGVTCTGTNMRISPTIKNLQSLVLFSHVCRATKLHLKLKNN